jgi:nucleotidyltransferase/DNA polymerase involved in DNA repair
MACEHVFVSILHADADCFFASVEQRDDLRLRGRPTMVATWVVMAASYEARAYGIHSAMHAAEARKLCPEVVAVEPRGEAYAEASAALFAVFEAASPLVERHGMEEAFRRQPHDHRRDGRRAGGHGPAAHPHRREREQLGGGG